MKSITNMGQELSNWLLELFIVLLGMLEDEICHSTPAKVNLLNLQAMELDLSGMKWHLVRWKKSGNVYHSCWKDFEHTSAANIKDSNHSSHSSFYLLPSGRRCMHHRTQEEILPLCIQTSERSFQNGQFTSTPLCTLDIASGTVVLQGWELHFVHLSLGLPIVLEFSLIVFTYTVIWFDGNVECTWL